MTKPRIAVLDDYQEVALAMADWSRVEARADVVVFRDHEADVDAVATRLADFDAICVMRERTPMKAELLGKLPRLKLLVSTGHRNASIDTKTAEARGIEVVHTGYGANATAELTWALIHASTRHIVEEVASVRAGGWQHTVGDDLEGQTLALLGLGTLGSRVAKVGLAFGMNVVAWSQNLTAEAASALGVRRVEKDELFATADILSIHVVLSSRTRGLVGARELGLMKPTARLVNTSRAPIVDYDALVAALTGRRLAGAAIDVYDVEPLPLDHALRTTPRLVTTPHIGYVSKSTYRTFFVDTVAHLERWLDAAGH
jgi:phosphoglycerate dehydrogenase-like enzyme